MFMGKLKLLVVASLLAAPAIASDKNMVTATDSVEITWQNYQSFSDIRENPNEVRGKFHHYTLNALHRYVDELSGALPDGQKMTLKVTDLDLAGEVVNNTRSHDHHGIPKISFEYSVLDANGTVVKSGSETLKGEKFRYITAKDRKQLVNMVSEKILLRNWFEQHISKPS